ncbi:MAG: YgjV family protein [Rhodothermales bacterium]|nr:YgjV family protein [Rhodothermales bacterium]MBO6779330.1 YgjV family protein [Rhodothermales bacterium]
MPPFSDIIGFIGVAANVGWPFFRSRTWMLLGQAFGAFLFALHYALISAPTAALLLTTAGLQALLAIPLGDRSNFRLLYLATIPVIGGIMAFSWTGVESLFASLGLALISLGRYQLKVIPFRALLVACIPMWLVHNLIVGSVPGLVSDALSFSSGLWMLIVTIRQERGRAPASPSSAG